MSEIWISTEYSRGSYLKCGCGEEYRGRDSRKWTIFKEQENKNIAQLCDRCAAAEEFSHLRPLLDALHEIGDAAQTTPPLAIAIDANIKSGHQCSLECKEKVVPREFEICGRLPWRAGVENRVLCQHCLHARYPLVSGAINAILGTSPPPPLPPPPPPREKTAEEVREEKREKIFEDLSRSLAGRGAMGLITAIESIVDLRIEEAAERRAEEAGLDWAFRDNANSRREESVRIPANI